MLSPTIFQQMSSVFAPSYMRLTCTQVKLGVVPAAFLVMWPSHRALNSRKPTRSTDGTPVCATKCMHSRSERLPIWLLETARDFICSMGVQRPPSCGYTHDASTATAPRSTDVWPRPAPSSLELPISLYFVTRRRTTWAKYRTDVEFSRIFQSALRLFESEIDTHCTESRQLLTEGAASD